MNRYAHFHTHRRSRRHPTHDYASAGWYFVTICTARREPLLGTVRDGIMGLSDLGCIAHRCWAKIPQHVPRARLDAFVVMPNHVHGLEGLVTHAQASAVQASAVPPLHATARTPVPRTRDPGLASMSDLSPEAGSLSSILRSYKAAVTREARQTDPAFGWQPRFHDHIVRSEAAHLRIRQYIQLNPTTWTIDRFHPDMPPPEASGGR